MAKVTATVFKAQAALMAAAMTTMLQDDTLTEVASDFKNNHHPAREFMRMFAINLATGVVTDIDKYVDDFYAGKYPLVPHMQQGNAPRTPLVVVSATLETANPRNIVITFNAQLKQARFTTIAGAAAAGKTIVSVTTVGAVMTVVVSADFVALDVVTVSSNVFGVGYNNLTLTDQAITNNIV